jgi:hypothetical protein
MPIGKTVAEFYKKEITALRTLQSTVLNRPAAYSDLHKMYGFADKVVLSKDDSDQIDLLIPICCGFALVFNRNDEGHYNGTMLSQVYTKVTSTMGHRIGMYVTAFENYRDNATSFKTLLSATDADADAKSASAGGAGK